MDNVGEVIIGGERNSRLLGRKLLEERKICKMVDDVGVYEEEIEKGDKVFEIRNEGIGRG